MAVIDLWYSRRQRDPVTGKPMRTKRHGRGKRYRVTAPGLPTLHFDRKVEAERADAARRTDLARGTYIDPALGSEKLEAFAERFRAGQLYRPSTEDAVERLFRLHVLPRLGRMSMSQIRASHIQAWVKTLDLAPATVRVAYAVLNSMFTAAVRDRVIAVSPCVGITLPAMPHHEHTILTPTQVHALANALPDRYRAAVYVGAGCGLRHGEVIGLEIDDIDFARRELRVVKQLTVSSGRSPYLAPPKTRTSRRTVELPRVTAEALERHLRNHPPEGAEVTDETDPRKVCVRPASLVFTNTAGRPINRGGWSHIWAPAARTLGLPESPGFHALRHYFATLLISAGASVKTVQMALGHSSPMITLNTYVGLWPDQIDRTRTLVDDALGGSSPLAAGA